MAGGPHCPARAALVSGAPGRTSGRPAVRADALARRLRLPGRGPNRLVDGATAAPGDADRVGVLHAVGGAVHVAAARGYEPRVRGSGQMSRARCSAVPTWSGR